MRHKQFWQEVDTELNPIVPEFSESDEISNQEEEMSDIMLYSITYEVDGKFYTTRSDYDHSWPDI